MAQRNKILGFEYIHYMLEGTNSAIGLGLHMGFVQKNNSQYCHYD